MSKQNWIRAMGVFGAALIFFGVLAWAFLGGLFVYAAYFEMLLGVICLGVYLTAFYRETSKTVFQKRELFYGLAGGVLTVFLLIGANVVANSKFGEKKFDLTTEKLHSLSEASVNTIKALPQNVEIYSFVIDPRARKLAQNLFDKYQYYSSGLQIHEVDPDQDPALLTRLGADVDEIAIVHPKTEKVVKVLKTQINEQEFTSALNRLTAGDAKTIYFLQGNGEPELADDKSQSGLYIAKFLLEREGYVVKTLDQSGQWSIPTDANAIVEWGSSKSALAATISKIEDYLNRGGVFILAQNPLISRTKDKIIDNGYEDLLKQYGLRFEKAVLLQIFAFGGKNIQIPTIQSDNFGKHPMVEDLKGSAVQLSTAQPVEALVKTPEGLSVSVILKSRKEVSKVTDIKGLLSGDEKKTYPESGEQGLVQLAEKQIKKDGASDQDSKPKKSQLLVLGDANFATNQLLQTGFNADFFLNNFAYLLGRPESISIRPRTWKSSTLEVSETQKGFIYFASIFAIPQLIILFGLAIWVLRRSRV